MGFKQKIEKYLNLISSNLKFMVFTTQQFNLIFMMVLAFQCEYFSESIGKSNHTEWTDQKIIGSKFENSL